jgi:TetR/AcrR family tetracycline transcriptional repressor
MGHTVNEGPRNRRPRGSLSLDEILDAAQRIVEVEGRDALTMRRVATEVGAGVMSLYGYLRSKEEILDHLAVRVLGDLAVPAQKPSDADWRPALRRYFFDLRATLVEHPEFQRLFAVQGAASQAAFTHAEAALAILADSGVDGPRAARTWIACMTYTVGFVLWELPRLAEMDTIGERPIEAGRDRMAALPADQFSHVVTLASVLSASTSTEQFAYGLDALMTGITTIDSPVDGR